MDLIADRIAVVDNGAAVDLASGALVRLATSSAGGPSEQSQWVARCDRFFRLRHQCLARLVDFGPYGDMRRFEAWRCDGEWRGAPGAADTARQTAAAFLAASGLSSSPVRKSTVVSCDGRPVLVPGDECGYEIADEVRARPVPAAMSSYGIELVGRREIAQVVELFSSGVSARPRAVALWGPCGSGVRTAVQDLARAARLHGFVPLNVSTHDLVSGFDIDAASKPGTSRSCLAHYAGSWPPVMERSLCLIVRGDVVEGWRRVVEWSAQSPGSRVVLFAGRREVAHVDGIVLPPLDVAALAAAVRPMCPDEATRRRILKAAASSLGIPGRFVSRLWGSLDTLHPPTARSRSRAAEQPAAYGSPSLEHIATETSSETCASWPRSELEALHRRLDGAIRLVERGRHEPGSRALRQIAGALARRRDWRHAARGGLALARSLLRRGGAEDARTVLVDVREQLAHADRDCALWVEASVLSGIASTDLGRLDEAETLLHSAVALARASRGPEALAEAAVALARCLFWRGRYGEAEQALASVDLSDQRASPIRAILAGALGSKIAIGREDVATAVSRATSTLEAAERLAQPVAIARAAGAAAFAHLAIGDRLAMERDIAQALRASRAAADPLCALRARLIRAEYAGHTGQLKAAAPLVARLSRMPPSRLPITIRARAAVLEDLLTGSSPGAEIARRHAAATGLQALTLFAPQPVSHDRKVDHAVVNDLLEVLRCCQSAEDGATVLGAVLAHLRRQLRAASLACVTKEGALLALEGSRADTRIAERVLAAGQPIVPHLCGGSIEGGAPVRYGGELMAALIGRWAAGDPHDWPRVALVLTLAAVAAGPAAAEVMAKGREITARTFGDLLGTSPAMDDVRRSVERAAAAPFAVLIQGESGSGKELVARALHRHGPRRDRPFCTINCAALPDELVESELFGHARGAFTGAAGDRPGVFEEAHTGTLFLDEVGELSSRAQAKLLRTIQEGELRRVGENISRRVDVRIVAATNRDLGAETVSGRFRHDLWYRLDVLRIAVPPLRERREDIAVLVARFWQEATMRLGSRAVLSGATIAALTRYDWPGNVRELQNVLSALAVRSPKRGIVPPTALPTPLVAAERAESGRLDAARRTFEERFVRAALVRTGGHRLHAAEELGVTRQGLAKLMSRLGISD